MQMPLTRLFEKMDKIEKIVRLIAADDDSGDLILDLGEEICNIMGWKEGDVMEWTDNKDGSWSLRKQDVDK